MLFKLRHTLSSQTKLSVFIESPCVKSCAKLLGFKEVSYTYKTLPMTSADTLVSSITCSEIVGRTKMSGRALSCSFYSCQAGVIWI